MKPNRISAKRCTKWFDAAIESNAKYPVKSESERRNAIDRPIIDLSTNEAEKNTSEADRIDCKQINA